MKKLSIIIPAFNERATVEEILWRVANASTPNYKKEIIVVDDGSNDGTEIILEKLKTLFPFILLRHEKNIGKGAAIKTALKLVTGDAVLIQDADLEYDPNDYQKLLGVFGEETRVVYGSRNLVKTKRGYLFYFLGGKFLTAFLNVISGSSLSDINTCYKLFSRDVIERIGVQSNGFEFCEEVTVKVLKLGYKIKEVPISYYPRKFSEGKKIRFMDGIIAILTILKYK